MESSQNQSATSSGEDSKPQDQVTASEAIEHGGSKEEHESADSPPQTPGNVKNNPENEVNDVSSLRREEDATEPPPLSVGKSVFARGWKVSAASATGLSHRRNRAACEDAFAFDVTSDGVLLAAMADGAGSRTRGGDGAKIACEAAVRSMRDRLPSTIKDEDATISILQDCAFDALEAVEARASKDDCDRRDFACTLLLLAATHNSSVGVQIGDGAIIVRSANPKTEKGERDGSSSENVTGGSTSAPLQTLQGDTKPGSGEEEQPKTTGDSPSPSDPGNDAASDTVLMEPQQGQYANQTYFLTSDGRIDKAERGSLHADIRGVVLFTDGLQRMALNRGSARSSFLNSLFLYLNRQVDGGESKEGLENLLRSEKIQSRTHDDATLLIAVPTSEKPDLSFSNASVESGETVESEESKGQGDLNTAATNSGSKQNGCLIPSCLFISHK